MKPQFKIKQLQNWEDEKNYSTEDLIKEYFNVRDAEIDRDGDVWLGGGSGTWLNEDNLEDFLKWTEKNRFSSQKKIAEELLVVAKSLVGDIISKFEDKGYELISTNGRANQAAMNNPKGKAVTVDTMTGDVYPSENGEYFSGDSREEDCKVVRGEWKYV